MPSAQQIQAGETRREHEREAGRLGDRIEISARDRAWAELRAQGLRFIVAGGIVAGVYIGTTSLLAEVFGVPFEASLAVGFALALVAHFSLQRLFVWRKESAYALPLHHQVGRYGAVAGVQYGLTAAITATLPHALGVPDEVVYLPTVVVLTCANFLVFRSRIFHAVVDPLHQ